MPSDFAVLTFTHNPSQPITVQMAMNGQRVSMELVCHWSPTPLSRNCLLGERLDKSEVRLTTYTAEPIRVLGAINVRVQYGDYYGMHPHYIVPGNSPPLLGRDWLQSIRLNWSSLKVARVNSSTRSLELLLLRYDHIFWKGLRAMKHFEARLVLRPGAKPKFCWPRLVPHALCEPIDCELNCLESE